MGALGTELYTSRKTLMQNLNAGVDADVNANADDNTNAWASSIPLNSTSLNRGKNESIN